jgi:hypothetical protein
MKLRLFPVLASLFLAHPALAQEAAPSSMGQPGQVAISGDFQLSFSYQSTSAAEGDDPDSVTTIQLAPAADFFVAPSFSVGGQVIFVHSSAGDSSITGYGLAPRVGYFAALGPKVGLWPTVSLGYVHSSADFGDLGDASGYQVIVQARLPLLFQPVDHFFLGIGPVFQTDLISKVEDEDADKDTAFGLQSVVGGYW